MALAEALLPAWLFPKELMKTSAALKNHHRRPAEKNKKTAAHFGNKVNGTRQRAAAQYSTGSKNALPCQQEC
ncbi:hypothetical protein [Erwinia oleae]|uniref:hypothetical protein n=1 Tax=Erwinia oleae TaxID=796334 RepID=UPI000A4BFAE9|nr:hypothetical protein [Erwinia oleae]